MTAQIEITKSLAGYTRISYKGEEIAKHYLSATMQGTREAFDISEDVAVLTWLEKEYEKEIDAIDNNLNN